MRDRQDRNADESPVAQGLSWSVCPLPKGLLVLVSTIQRCPHSFSGTKYPSQGHQVHLCSAPFPGAPLLSPDYTQALWPPSPCSPQTLTGEGGALSVSHLHGLLMPQRDGDRGVQPVRTLRPNTLPDSRWGTARRALQQEIELSALSEAIHVVGKLHTDGTRGTEGPAHQSGSLARLRELVSLDVNIATFWAKKKAVRRRTR